MNICFTVREVAQRYRVSTDIIYDLLNRKEMHGIKFGSQWRITEEALKAFENRDIEKKGETPHADRNRAPRVY